MTPEQFLKKWLPVAEHTFKGKKVTMKDDLDNVIRSILSLEEYQHLLDRREENTKVNLDSLKFREERPEDFKEIGQDNWKFFGDYYTPPSA